MGDMDIESGPKSEEMVSKNGSPGTVHVLMIAHPALPHLTPMVLLAKQLITHGGLRCTILSFESLINKVTRAVGKMSDGIQLLGLSDNPPGFYMPPGTTRFVVDSSRLRFATDAYVGKVRADRAAGVEGGPTCMLSDLTLAWTVDTAETLNIPRYYLSASSACFVAVAANQALLRHTVSGGDPVVSSTHTGFPVFRQGEMRNTLGSSPTIAAMFAKSSRQTAGALVNTFYELESSAVDAVRNLGIKTFTIGPLQSKVIEVGKFSFHNEDKDVGDECLRWLDQQPKSSVVYVNFGTTGFWHFTIEMVQELASGLEASKVRFLWVLRPPPDVKPEDEHLLIPPGFEERVKDRGLVIRGWAPQLKILDHPSTAVFMQHCGWNSIMESVARGIPFIGWPTYADQIFNGKYVAEVSKIGLLLPLQEDFWVDKQEIAKALQTAVSSEEGKIMKENADRLKAAASKSLEKEGSSTESLREFVELIKR